MPKPLQLAQWTPKARIRHEMPIDELLERYEAEGDPDLPCQCIACGFSLPDEPAPCPKCGCHAREHLDKPGIHPAKVIEEVKALRVAGLDME